MEDDNEQGSQPTGAAPAPEAGVGDAPLGEGGKKALDAERAARRAAEARVKELEPLAATARQLEDQQKSETQRLTEQAATWKAQAEAATAEALRLRVAADVGLPRDLLEFLPAGGDEDALRANAEKLKAATASTTRRPHPDPMQGARPGSQVAQLTTADLTAMTPDAIVEARRAGRLNALMGITT